MAVRVEVPTRVHCFDHRFRSPYQPETSLQEFVGDISPEESLFSEHVQDLTLVLESELFQICKGVGDLRFDRMGVGVLRSDRSVEAVEPDWGRAREIAFYAVIALLLVGFGLFWKLNLSWLLAWVPGDFLERFYASQLEFDHVTGPFGPHIVHYLALSASHVIVIFGLALQLRRP